MERWNPEKEINNLSPTVQNVVRLLILIIDHRREKRFERIELGKSEKLKLLEQRIQNRFKKLDEKTQWAIGSIIADPEKKYWRKWASQFKDGSDSIHLNIITEDDFCFRDVEEKLIAADEDGLPFNTWEIRFKIPMWYKELKILSGRQTYWYHW
jgi:hypothetical protein